MIVNTSNYYVIKPTFTLPTGTHRYVLFMIAGEGGAYSYFPNTVDIAGTAATMITEAVADEAAQIWGANIPDSTAAGDYTITFDGTSFTRFHIAVFTGVSGDPVVDSDAFRDGSASSDGDSLTVDCVGGGWVHDIVWAGTEKTHDGAQTVIYNVTGRPGISYKSGLAHGTTTMSWTWTDSRSAHAVVSLRPFRPGGGIVMF